MKILSVYLGHNSTIAYMKDGKLLYVLHEEKFDNVKNSDNFPIKALQYLASKEDLSDLDTVAVVGKAINRWMLRYIPNYTKDSKHKIINFEVTIYDRILYFFMKFFPRFMNRVNDTYMRVRKMLYTNKYIELIQQGIGTKIKKEKVIFVSHHECHALSVIYFYGLHHNKEPMLVFTMDGGGDKNCATVRIWNQGETQTLATVRNRYSIGDLWSKSFTGGMGMSPLEHEYKVMGLAAYTSSKYSQGAYDRLFKNTIKLNGLSRKSKIPGNKSHVYYHNKLRGLRFDNIAGALQDFTEDIVIQWIKNGVEKTGIKKIAVAGGVFMNVKLNKKIHEQDRIDKVYFMPSAGDDSTPLGGILAGYKHLKKPFDELQAVESMYKGISYSESEVEEFFKDKHDRYEIQKYDNQEHLSQKIAQLLDKFQVVALFQGQGERGARSLCNRAILSNASSLDSFLEVNDMIKMRDFWMPFAPTILEEYAEKYIENRNTLQNRVEESSKYMITAFDSTDLAKKHLKAALHQKDKTLRPQMVSEKSNPLMYTILKEYERLTGMGGVMNTSLNIHGYPLVGTIEQALFTLENSGLKHIVIENYLISKK